MVANAKPRLKKKQGCKWQIFENKVPESTRIWENSLKFYWMNKLPLQLKYLNTKKTLYSKKKKLRNPNGSKIQNKNKTEIIKIGLK